MFIAGTDWWWNWKWRKKIFFRENLENLTQKKFPMKKKIKKIFLEEKNYGERKIWFFGTAMNFLNDFMSLSHLQTQYIKIESEWIFFYLMINPMND